MDDRLPDNGAVHLAAEHLFVQLERPDFLVVAVDHHPVLITPLLALRLLDLRHLQPFRRNRLANHHVATRCARHGAADDQQIVLGVDLGHTQVAHSDSVSTHPAGCAHPLHDA